MIGVILRILLVCVAALRFAEGDVCVPNPCRNDGTCQPYQSGYNWGYLCTCKSGYVGAQCQWDGDDCVAGTTTPCVNGGSCVKMQDGRFCICPGNTNTTINFGGHYCEKVNPCTSCPSNTRYCQPGAYTSSGRLCLNDGHKEIA